MNFEKYYERNFENVIDNVCTGDNDKLSLSHFQRDLSTTPESKSPSPSLQSSHKAISPNSTSPQTKAKNRMHFDGAWGNCGKSGDKSSWIGRQIAAAYDEHASIIISLRQELEESKQREQALVQEFANKFQELKIKQRSSSTTASTLTLEEMKPFLKSQTNSSRKIFDDGDEDMPMDEMIHTSKMDRNARAMELYEQQLAMDKLKKQSSKQIEKLRKQSERHIMSIENALKEKVSEIKRLKQEASYYKKQSEVSMATPSPGASIIGNDTPFSESTPTHSLSDCNYAYPSPVNGNRKLIGTPVQITPKSADKSNLTPIDRMRRSLSNESESPQNYKKAINFENVDDASSENQKALMQKLIKMIEAKMTQSDPNDKDKDGDEVSLLQNLNEDEAKFLETMSKVFRKTFKEEMKALTTLKSKLQESNKEIQIGASKVSQMTLQMKQQEEQINHLQDQLNSAHASIRNTASLEELLKSMASDRKEKDRTDEDYNLKLKEVQMEKEALKKEQIKLREEADKSVSAIQRVMADVTASKEEEIKDLTDELKELREKVKLMQNSSFESQPSLDTSEVISAEVEDSELMKLREEVSKNVDLMDQLAALQTELNKSLLLNKEMREKVDNNESDLRAELEKALATNKELEDKLRNIESKMNETRSESENDKLNLQKELDILREQNVELVTVIAGEKAEADKVLQDLKDKTTERGKTLSMMLESEERSGMIIEEMKKRIEDMDKQIEKHKDELMSVEDVLKAAKVSHEREQKLEDELSELRSLLDNTMKNKASLRNQLQSKEEELDTKTKNFQQKLYSLQSQIISMKEEKLELKASLRKAEDAVSRTNRVLAVMQETSETEGSAPQIVLDMKEHLREQLDLVNQLREKSNDAENSRYFEKLSDGINTSICLLEAAIFGNSIVSPKSVPGIARWNESSAVAILEAQKKCMRSELELELKQEQDQELVSLSSELALVKKKNDEYKRMLFKKDEEMNVLRASLKESSVGYISGDESDLEDESAPGKPPLHIAHHSGLTPKEIEELLKAKEKAEAEAKQNAESLANAKMIISSLEQSKKSMIEDLKVRLHDSNSAIVSLLDQSGKHEKESAELRSNLHKLKTEKSAIEMQLNELKKCNYPDAESKEQLPQAKDENEEKIVTGIKSSELSEDTSADDNDEVIENDASTTECDQ